jgi:hypothetical protein
MKIEKDNTLLYIHPKKEGSEQPILDKLTKKILWATRNKIGKGVLLESGEFLANTSTKGVHHCTGCDKKCPQSAAHDIVLPNKVITNTLAVHYVACHRDELSKEELAKIESIQVDEETLESEKDPTEEELGTIKKCMYHMINGYGNDIACTNNDTSNRNDEKDNTKDKKEDVIDETIDEIMSIFKRVQ